MSARRTVVTVSKSLHKKAAMYAARNGVSLEDFTLEVIAERVGRDMRRPAQLVSVSTAGAPTYHRSTGNRTLPKSR